MEVGRGAFPCLRPARPLLLSPQEADALQRDRYSRPGHNFCHLLFDPFANARCRRFRAPVASWISPYRRGSMRSLSPSCRFVIALALVGSFALSAGGCKKGVPLSPVSGKVNVRNTALTAGVVTF